MLDGVWIGDSVENFETEQLAVAAGWIKGTTLMFRRGEVTVKIPERAPRVAPYQVIAQRKRTMTVAVIEPQGEPTVVKFSMDSEDAMRWHLGAGRSAVLRRQ